MFINIVLTVTAICPSVYILQSVGKRVKLGVTHNVKVSENAVYYSGAPKTERETRDTVTKQKWPDGVGMLANASICQLTCS